MDTIDTRCKTKYPVVLVHGIGFGDSNNMLYWGRIPKVLRSYGADVYSSSQDGWGNVESNATQLIQNIDAILSASKADKVNLIAHSKGGIDSRYLLRSSEAAAKIASITTISTPHNGSHSMDLLMRIPSFLVKFAGVFVNGISRLMGDRQPDFYKTCIQMTTKKMDEFNTQAEHTDDVYCQSYAAVMTKPSSDVIMMIQNIIVKAIEGKNDGLVTLDSAAWQNFKGVLTGYGKRGVSHSDIVDLRRKPFIKPGSLISRESSAREPDANIFVADITDVYVDIVSDLKQRYL